MMMIFSHSKAIGNEFVDIRIRFLIDFEIFENFKKFKKIKCSKAAQRNFSISSNLHMTSIDTFQDT